ncbi:TIGR02281 family clan AA aspartic protease [uncultured Maritalea sp.]|uniref:retropepsin-like aspartic protease family protein n=1 Tax=uncultured Maritalea sp. TaxID=757249 RepID=UPI002621F212|nr:TIGR02281 family clan AA aspartic protease [uncultured Maritalea sp.]
MMLFIGMALIVSVALALLISADVGAMIGLGQDQFGQLVILVAVLVLVAGGSFGRRIRFNEMLSGAILWVGIFALAIFGYSFRTELEQYGSRFLSELNPGSAYVSESGDVVRFRRSMGGSYLVAGDVNGSKVKFIFDTGATSVVLTFEDAKRAGIDIERLRYNVPVSTANGEAKAAFATLNRITVGNIERNNIPAFVAQDGLLDTSLLGMSFLETLTSYTVSGDALELRD